VFRLGGELGRIEVVGQALELAPTRLRDGKPLAIEDEDAGAPLGGWRRYRQTGEARINEAADPEFERGRAEGRALTLDEAISLAGN